MVAFTSLCLIKSQDTNAQWSFLSCINLYFGEIFIFLPLMSNVVFMDPRPISIFANDTLKIFGARYLQDA